MEKYLKKLLELKCHNEKYRKIYIQLIKHRKESPLTNEYTEEHHIFPSCLCDTDEEKKDKDNLVILSAREHYIAHALLCKFTKLKQMYSAYFFMTPNEFHTRRYSPKQSITYERLKKEQSILKSLAMTGDKHFNYGKTTPESTKKKQSQKLKGKPISKQHAEQIRRGLKQRYITNPELRGPNHGKVNSVESNRKNSEQNKKVIKTEDWNRKNQQQNTGRIHIANTITKERKRPPAEEANHLIHSQNGVWIKLATMKPIPDYSSIESIISSISES